MFIITEEDKIINTDFQTKKILKDIPNDVYYAEYDGYKEITMFTPAIDRDSPYLDLGRSQDEEILDEMEYFFQQTSQRGILLYGEPGNGKTRLALEMISRMCKLHGAVGLVNPELDSIREIVEAVRSENKHPIIILFDEFDQMIKRKEHSVLRFLDGSDSIPGILTVAALNDIEEVPERIYKRPGRFGLICEIGCPTEDERIKFVSALVNDPEQVKQVIRATEGLSLDYVREICHRVQCRGQTLEQALRVLKLKDQLRYMPADPQDTDPQDNG